jgi:RNA polymerase primary sigma factor
MRSVKSSQLPTPPVAANEAPLEVSAAANQAPRTSVEGVAKKTPLSRKGREDAAPNLVAAYMREVAGVSVLSPDDEQRLAQDIATWRHSMWRELLSYPPLSEAIIACVQKRLTSDSESEKMPNAEMQTYVEAARALRDRETKGNATAFDEARLVLAAKMSETDLDGLASEAIVTDLEKMLRGDPRCEHLEATLPPQGSRPFASYVEAVRSARSGLARVKNHFVRANLRLVISIARRFDHGLMPLQDIIQEGNIGLMKAVDRFDVRLGFRFSTYASWWIRHAINRALANKGRTVRLPAHVSADLQRIGRARREIEALTGSRATPQELATHAELALTRVQKLLRLALEPTVSLDAPLGGEDARGLVDMLVDPGAAAPGEGLENEGMHAHLRDALARLGPLEIDILFKRYGIDAGDEFEPLTLRQLGELHSLSRERIRQLQERALHKLRQEFNRRDLLIA